MLLLILNVLSLRAFIRLFLLSVLALGSYFVTDLERLRREIDRLELFLYNEGVGLRTLIFYLSTVWILVLVTVNDLTKASSLAKSTDPILCV